MLIVCHTTLKSILSDLIEICLVEWAHEVIMNHNWHAHLDQSRMSKHTQLSQSFSDRFLWPSSIHGSMSHEHVMMWHYSDVIINATASQITGVSIVYSAVCSGGDQRKHQSSASLAFVRGISRWPVNSPHKGPSTRKMLPFDDVIMKTLLKYGSLCQSEWAV